MSYLYILFAYIAGSIPFGLLLTKFSGLGDIRKLGSGNIGATNVLRTGNKKLALLTLLFDGLKGILVVLLGKILHFSDDLVYLASLCAVLGHMFPIWLGFKGGKGVATTAAIILVLDIKLGLLLCAIWLVIFYLTKISSIASITATISLILLSIALLNDWMAILLFTALSILVISKHYPNIKRIINGEENTLKI